MKYQPRNNPIFCIAAGLAFADGIVIFVANQRWQIIAISLLAAGLATVSFFFKPSSNE